MSEEWKSRAQKPADFCWGTCLGISRGVPEVWARLSYVSFLPHDLVTGGIPHTGSRQSVCIPIPKKGNAKACSHYRTIALILHASKAMLKILQARLQQYVNHELPDVQVGFTKGRGTRGQIANIRWIIEKAREFKKKHLLLLYWLCQSLWLCIPQQTLENSERDGNTRPPDLPLEKSVCRSGSNS